MQKLGRQLTVPAAVALLVILAWILAAILAPWVAPYSEREMVGEAWGGVTKQHWLGLDNVGRDMLSRLLFGARTTISVALATTTLAFVVGVVLGFLSGIKGKWFDIVASRTVDILMSIPGLILALIFLALLGTSVPVLIATVAVPDALRVFRLSRALAAGIVRLEYFESAQLQGESLGWLIAREMLPNALPPLMANFGLSFCYSILFIAALSFLGLGIQPPTADWGGMVRDNATAISFGGLAPFIPALALACLTVSVNLVVDWILSLRSPHKV